MSYLSRLTTYEESIVSNLISMDKQYRTREGQDVRILCTDLGCDTYPVAVVVGKNDLETYTKDGKWHEDFESNENDLVEVSSYDHLKIDDKVLVWSNLGFETMKHKQHFAGLSADGQPRTFSNGRTSYTQSDTTVWDNCKLYKEDVS